MNPDRKINNKQETIKIKLDPIFYGKIDDFDKRFPEDVPSLVDCYTLNIEGDVRFEKDVRIKGSVTIRNTGKNQAVINAGTIIDKDIVF
jgi:UTP--glucose-1-phosphate uridylyltransferase